MKLKKAGLTSAVNSIHYKIGLDVYDPVSGSPVIGTVSGLGTVVSPWQATITGLTNTSYVNVGAQLISDQGVGRLFAGNPALIQVSAFTSNSHYFPSCWRQRDTACCGFN